MNEIELVTKQEILGKEFMAYGSIEEPYFLAKNVADLIGHSNITMMLNSVDEDEKIVLRTKDSLGRENNAAFLTENGLYEVLMLSRKPVAKQFKKAIKQLLHELRTKKVSIIKTHTQEELAVMDKEARAAEANIWLKLSEKYKHNEDYSQILDAYATKALEGKFVLPLPKVDEANYSATEVGKMLGISSKEVGKIAKSLGIKENGEYGKWYIDKSPYSQKEVNVFRYTQKAINKIKESIA